MASFATVEQLETYMRVDLSTDAAGAQFALDTATAFIQGWTGQTLFLVEDDPVTVVPKWGTILLPQMPVAGVTSVESEGEAVEYFLRPAGVIMLRGTWTDAVDVVYTHGFSTIPTAVQVACVQEAARIYQASDQAAAGVRSETETIDDYSRTVQYMEGSEGSIGGGMMLEGSKHLLAPYRMRSLV